MPYWSNPPLLTFDIWALWHSGVSAQMSKIKNDGLDQYGIERFKQQLFGTASTEEIKHTQSELTNTKYVFVSVKCILPHNVQIGQHC